MKTKDGFTLIELLLALTILSVIIAIISGAFRVGIRAWERGETVTQDRQRSRIVLELMKRQIASVYTGTSAQRIPFRGTEKSMDFVSILPLHPNHQTGIVQARYNIRQNGDKEQLCFSERNLLKMASETDSPASDCNDPLIRQMTGMSFEYLAEKDRDSEWVSYWNSEKDYPKAVRIVFHPNSETSPMTIIIRLMPELKQG